MMMKGIFFVLSTSVLTSHCGVGKAPVPEQAKPKSLVEAPTQEPTQGQELALANPPATDDLAREIEDVFRIFRQLYEKEDSAASALPTPLPPYVKFSDVKHWKQLAGDYAAGYDASHKLLAIYDLTYQNTLAPEFIGRTILGTIGIGDLNLRELIRLLKKAIDQQQLEIEALGSAYAGPLKTDDFVKVNKVLKKIDRKYGDIKGPIVGDWWTKVPIKKQNGTKPLADASVAFKLSDIDVDSLMNGSQKINYYYNLNQLQEHVSKLFNIDASRLFEQLEFRRNANGSYNLTLSPLSHLVPNEQPDKVVDFMRYKSTFGYAFLYLAIKTALTNLSSAIPQPVVAALIKYAVHRWFELYEEQLSFHRFKAYENLSAAEKEDPSAFSFLSPDQRAQGAVYVLSHEGSIFHTIFQPRDEAYFRQSINHEINMVKKNVEWTQQRNLNLKPLSSLFYLAEDDAKSQSYMLIMGGQARFHHAPFLAVNYNRPGNERIKRNFFKSIYDVLVAVPMPFPGMNSLMEVLFDAFIMDDVRDGIRWDARLASLLSRIPNKDYSRELEWIYAQRVNPFEFDLDEERVFVERSKGYLGL